MISCPSRLHKGGRPVALNHLQTHGKKKINRATNLYETRLFLVYRFPVIVWLAQKADMKKINIIQ